MTREDLLIAITGPPLLRVGRRLRAILDAPEPETKLCANPVCDSILTVTRKRKKYCCKLCAGQATVHANMKYKRGSNPDRHIRIRVNGKRIYLSRHVVEQCIGVKLTDREIVHHVDGDKHHNCFWKDATACERCRERGKPNLELLTGEARAEHIRRHQEQLQAARRRRNW